MNELLFQLLSRLGLEPPEKEGQNPIARVLRTDPYTPDDEPYLRQFLGVPKDGPAGGLVPTDLRPTNLPSLRGSGTKEDLPWFSPAANPYDPSSDVGLMRVRRSLPRAEEIDALQQGAAITMPNRPIPGLGRYRASVGKGSSGNPYLSVYDKWDFESPVVSPLMQSLMDRVGKGFHVYERYPLTKDAGGQYQVGGDIELK